MARAHVRALQGHDARADFDAAVAQYERHLSARPEEPWFQIGLAQAVAGQGRGADAVRWATAAMARLEKDTWEGPEVRRFVAEILWQFGERDRAVAELERYVTGFGAGRDLLRHNPRFAPLREDPRVRRLVN